ncbi:MAG: MobA/MobL family protein [Longibaculum sp.]
MARHSFIQMTKLPNVKGRISYITSKSRQENLYATYRTADNTFWSNLARESQQEFKRSGTKGKCIEARELVIALPETFTQYEPQQLLERFTDEFRKRYCVECVSALHHNKRKTNYHIHLIFSERTLLPEADIKIASRSVFYDETGKRVRTKKEITGEDGKIREGCTVIKKGEVYESHLFSVKDDRYKSEAFLEGEKEFYTALINSYISDPEQHLKVFDKNSVYLPTKKIGKNNPKEAEIKADNEARQEWNRTADMALVTGIAEAKIMEIKQTEIQDKASESIRTSGWLPDMFRSIVGKAKDFLQNLIREQDMPPKPTLNINMTEFRIMQQLMIRVQDSAKEIKHLQNRVLPKLKQELKDTTGLFKGKERKALAEKIRQTEEEISDKLDKLPDILKEDGYPDVQAFMATYREMEGVVERYEREVWEYNLKLKQKENPAKKPPEKQSVREHLRQLQEKGRQLSHKKKSFDRDR